MQAKALGCFKKGSRHQGLPFWKAFILTARNFGLKFSLRFFLFCALIKDDAESRKEELRHLLKFLNNFALIAADYAWELQACKLKRESLSELHKFLERKVDRIRASFKLRHISNGT